MEGTFSSMYKMFGLTFSCSRKKWVKIAACLLDVVTHACRIPSTQKAEVGGLTIWAVWCTVDQPELYNPVVHFGLKLMTQERVILSSGLPSAQGWDDRHAPLLLASSKPSSNIAFVSFTQLRIFFFATLRISLFPWKSSCIAFIVCGGKIFSLAETKHQNCYSTLVGIKINQPGL